MPLYRCPECGQKIYVSADEHKRVGMKRITEHIRTHGEKSERNGETVDGHVRETTDNQGSTGDRNEPGSGEPHTVPTSV